MKDISLLNKTFFRPFLLKHCITVCLCIAGITSNLFAQTACNQRVIDDANFTYTGPGAAPARWNIKQADTGNVSLDQTAFSYVASGNFSTVNTNFSAAGSNNNATRQYAVVNNPNTLSPQYANIPTDGMLVINPLQGQNDQYITYNLGGLVPGNIYNIEIKVWNVIDMAMPGQCQSWCNWNDQLFIDMANNQAGAEHSNQSGQNWTGTNGSGNWSQGTNQVNNILKISSGGAFAIITGTMQMPANGSSLSITLAKGNSSNPVVLGIDYIKVYGCQQEAINISGGTPNVCEATQFTLTAQGISPANDSSYQWYHNGVLLPNDTTASINIVSGIVPGVQDIYKAIGKWDNISDTLIPKLCCSSVDGTSDEVFRQSFNGLTYTCAPQRPGGYANIPGIGVTSYIDPSYIYAGTGCNNLDNGQYAIVQTSYAGQFWTNRPEVKDHTGVAGSGALFVNAIGGVGQIFYKSSFSSSLCNNTTYDFSIWYASLAAPGETVPNIEFDIINSTTNTIVASAFTGAIPKNEQWYPADVTFTTPATGSPTYSLQAINLITGSSGNDLMLDDIVVKKCTPGINLYQNGTTDSVVSVCDNNPVDIAVNTFYSLPLEITGSTTGTVYYQWMSATSPTGPWTLSGTPETTGTFSATPTPTTTYYRAKVSANSASAATGTVPVATDCGNDAMTNSFSLTKGGNFSIPPVTGTTSYCIGNTIILTGDPGTGDQWEWRKGNTAASATPIAGYTYSNNASNKIYTKAFAITDTGNYYFYAKTTAGCESYSAIHITSNPLPSITVAATSAGVCVSSTALTSNLTYSATTGTPTKYTITWDAAGITAGLVNIPTTNLPASPIGINVPAIVQAGIYTGTIVVTSAGGCSSTGTTFTLTVSAVPTITTAAAASSVCVSTNAQTSNLTYSATTGTPTKYTITWDAAGITAGLINVASTNLPASPIDINVPANTQAGTYTGTIVVSNAGSCSSTGTTFTLAVNNILSASDISCGTATNNSVQFNWTAVTGATSYTISHTVNGGSSISDPAATSGTYTISSLNPGDAVVITVLPVGTGCFKAASFSCSTTTCPTVNFGALQDRGVCSNGLLTQKFPTPGFTYTWTNSNPLIGLAAASTGSSNAPLTISFTTANPTGSDISGEITVVATSGICNYPDSFKVTVYADAVVTLTSAPATSPQSVCVNNPITNIIYSITGTGNSATAGGLPNGVTGSYNAGVFTISGTPTQTGTFNYIITATGTCNGSTTTGTITVTTLPVISSVTAGNPSSCGGSDGSFTINGLTASSSYTVNFIKDGIAQTAQTLTSNASGSVVVSSLKQGNYTGITITTGGGCTSAAVTTTLSDPSVFNPVASSNSPCLGSTLNLVSTTSADPSATYSWTGPNGYTANIASPSITNTTINMDGDYTVKATVSGCSSSSKVTVTINPAPASPTGVDASNCGSGAVTLSATLSGGPTDVLNWYSDQGLTSPVATGASFLTTSLTSTTPYYVTETNTTSCVSAPTTVNAIINSIPLAPTGINGTGCAGGTVNLGATPSTAGDLINWYSDVALTSPVATGTNSFTTPNINLTLDYYIVETSPQACTSTSSATVIATINTTPPVPDVTSTVNYCLHDTTATPLSASGTGLTWYTATGAIGSVAPTPSTDAGGTTIYYVTASNGICESQKAMITVTVDPISAYAGGPIVDVNEGQTVTLNGVANGNNIAISWSPSIYLSDNTIENPDVTPLKNITYTMRVSSTDGCKASDTVQVVILKNIIIPNAFSPNGDGINDKWIITYLDEYRTAVVSVFNRYGQKIFESPAGGYAWGRPWDGTYSGSPVPVGTYYYIIKLADGKKPLSGSISVIR